MNGRPSPAPSNEEAASDSLTIMDREGVLAAFRAESQALASVVVDWTDEQWALPTRCLPWTARDLLAHIRVGVARLPGMLASTPPAQALVPARQYYRPDHRFSAATNEQRILTAQEQAAAWPDGRALADGYAITWQEVYRSCVAEPADRVVRTRHGDAMLLSDFMVTRVVEVAVHGLDLASALNSAPWLTEQAGAVVEELLTAETDATSRADSARQAAQATSRALGWGQAAFIEKATGREPLTVVERQQLTDANLHSLSLG
jgi:uncharacterized protein (TIGR03083 family)